MVFDISKYRARPNIEKYQTSPNSSNISRQYKHIEYYAFLKLNGVFSQSEASYCSNHFEIIHPY